MKTNLLSQIPVFSDLPVEELDHLQSTLQVKYLQRGEILFREGDQGEHFYVVTDGKLEILLGAETQEELAAQFARPRRISGRDESRHPWRRTHRHRSRQ